MSITLLGFWSAVPPTLDGKRRVELVFLKSNMGPFSIIILVLRFIFIEVPAGHKALNFSVVLSKLAEYPFNASLEVPRTAPFRHLTAAGLSSFCLTVLARCGLTPRRSSAPRAQVFFFFFGSWCGSCLFSAILGTRSACNKLLKWRPLACLLSRCLPQPLPPAPYR